MIYLHRVPFNGYTLVMPPESATAEQILEHAALLALSSQRHLMNPDDWQRMGDAYLRRWGNTNLEILG